MDLLIKVRDNEAPFVLELLNKFDFVEVKEANEVSLLENLESSLEQMQAMREGKLPKPTFEELFD